MSDMKILLVLSQRKEYNGRDKITSIAIPLGATCVNVIGDMAGCVVLKEKIKLDDGSFCKKTDRRSLYAHDKTWSALKVKRKMISFPAGLCYTDKKISGCSAKAAAGKLKLTEMRNTHGNGTARMRHGILSSSGTV